MKSHWIKAAIGAVLSVCLGGCSQSEAEEPPKMEKCYGIVKKGMNDCGGNDHPCQGQAAKDNDSDEWLYLPMGTCEKITGGTLKAKDKGK